MLGSKALTKNCDCQVRQYLLFCSKRHSIRGVSLQLLFLSFRITEAITES